MCSVGLWPSDGAGTGRQEWEPRREGWDCGARASSPQCSQAHKLISDSLWFCLECFCQLRVQRAKQKETKDRQDKWLRIWGVHLMATGSDALLLLLDRCLLFQTETEATLQVIWRGINKEWVLGTFLCVAFKLWTDECGFLSVNGPCDLWLSGATCEQQSSSRPVDRPWRGHGARGGAGRGRRPWSLWGGTRWERWGRTARPPRACSSSLYPRSLCDWTQGHSEKVLSTHHMPPWSER